VAKYLFSALALAVVLSMIASYLVAMSVIPIYCARFLTAESARESEEGATRGPLGAFMRVYERLAARYERILDNALDHKFAVIGAVAVVFVLSMLIYPLIGTELFPQTDAGQFIIDYRAPVGTRIEITEELTERMENLVRQVIPASELLTIVSNLGLAPGFSSIYSSNAAPDSGFMMVALKSTHKVSTFVYIHRLKKLLPQAVPEMRTFFTSGSIIDSVLNFGLAAPIDVQLTAPTYRALFPVARGRKGAPERARGGQHFHSAGGGLPDTEGQSRPGQGGAPGP
jgi:multidrug efflux pump subunit AcrB